MQATTFVLKETFSSKTFPDRDAVCRAVALWLAKELQKTHG